MTAALLLTASCSLFLEKPDTTGTVDQEAVFSTTKNAEAALMSCYRNILRHGWPGGMGIGHCAYGAISGEVGRGYNWHGNYHISQQGLNVNGTDGSDAGAENYGNFYAQNCFMGASGTLLIVSTLVSQGYEVTALEIATWSIPIAVISILVGAWRDLTLDKKLEKMTKGGAAKCLV